MIFLLYEVGFASGVSSSGHTNTLKIYRTKRLTSRRTQLETE
jgi:hypothetical protein